MRYISYLSRCDQSVVGYIYLQADNAPSSACQKVICTFSSDLATRIEVPSAHTSF